MAATTTTTTNNNTMVSPSDSSTPRKPTRQTKKRISRSSSRRSKKRRDYGRGDSVVEFDDDYDDDVGGPVSLSKLVIPWTVMFVVSVIATLVVAYHQHRFNHNSNNQRRHYYHRMSLGLYKDDDNNNLDDQMESFEDGREEFLLSPSALDEHYYPPTFFHDEFEDNESRGVLKRWLQISPQSVSSHTQQRVHKPVYDEEHPPLFPLSARDRLGFFLAIIGLMIAAGGGIGGGGLLVPIYILVMGFSPKHAIPLSNVTVLGGAVANMVLNSKKRHPLADRPLIDWDLILVMEPLTIAGALVGAFLNKVLPELFLTIMLVVLLAFTAYNTLKKAFKMYKAETRKLREQGLKPDGTKESELTHMAKSEDVEDQNKAGDELLDDMDLQDGENPGTSDMEDARMNSEASRLQLQKILDEERTTPMFNVNVLFCMFIVVLMINLLKGGGAFSSPIGIKCGSGSFWVANGIILGWIVLISLYVRSYLVKRYEIKESCGYEYQEGDIKWDGRATIVYPVICALAGFFAGMFGVGGGIVKGPLMLAMGVHPAVASASSACMILFTSFTAATSFYVFGLLDEQYAPVCFVIGFVATYFGQIGLSILMKRAQRNSYIAFSIGGVVFLSAVLMTAQSLLSMAEGEHHSSGGICGKDS